MTSTSCQTSWWQEAISFTQDDRGGDSNTSESDSDRRRNPQRRGRTGSVSQRRRTNTDISGETSEGPRHRNADRTSAAVEDGAAPAAPAAADAASLNAARIKRQRAAPTDEEPSPLADRSWPLEVRPIAHVKARRMQVTAQRLKLWQKPFATKRWHLRRNWWQSHI